ncbi:MAG: hypothetical protein B7X64_07350 [Halothiobacillus sp. 39-53-45]|nr:MAG: hypothetical protein B7X64_07350 [Halothiobacillus sp. 39-53-45]
MMSPLLDIVLVLQNLGLALGIGLLIGLERGWHERTAADGSRVAGVRTLGLIGLSGGLIGLLASQYGGVVLAAGIFVLGVILAVSYWLSAQRDQSVGITTEIASFLTFTLGVFAVSGYAYVAVVAAVISMILLGLKPVLHAGLQKLSEQELFATFKLLLLALVILPILPNGDFGPWGALNPWVIGWMVLLLAGLSFVGYFLMRILGSRQGLLVTSLLGGLVSSTALTLTLARFNRERRDMTGIVAVGIIVASTLLFPRVLIEVGLVNADLLSALLPPIIAMLLTASLGAVIAWRWASVHESNSATLVSTLKNPLELGAALRFTLILVAIMLLAGIYGLAAISGLADVDALSLSLSKMAGQGQITADVATQAIVLAILVNTLVKTALAFFIGGRLLGWRVAVVLVPTVGVGMAAALLL